MIPAVSISEVGLLASAIINLFLIALNGYPPYKNDGSKTGCLVNEFSILVDMILQSVGRNNTKDISFTVSGDVADEALKVIEDSKSRLNPEHVEIEKNVAKVSVVGAGMMSNPGVAAKMFECLFNADINIKMISTSEIRVTVLIDEAEAVKAMNATHDAFGLED